MAQCCVMNGYFVYDQNSQYKRALTLKQCSKEISSVTTINNHNEEIHAATHVVYQSFNIPRTLNTKPCSKPF